MRRVKGYLWLLVLALVLIMVSSIVQAQSSGRIAFSSDRAVFSEHDVWVSNDDGSQQVLFSNEPNNPEVNNLLRPSICNDGQWIFYDNSSGAPEFVGDLWVKSNSGGGAAQRVLACTDFEGAPDCYHADAGQGVEGELLPVCVQSTNPPPPVTGGKCGCKDVACGSPAAFDPGNPRILFVYQNPVGTRRNIAIATWDASSELLGPACKLTDSGGDPAQLQNSFSPAWCGNNHVVFAQTNSLDDQGVAVDDISICTMNATTTEVPTVRCHITNDGLHERYPSCSMRNGQWTVAYAMQKTPSQSHTSRICTVDLDRTTFDFIPGTEHCTPNEEEDLTISWTKPTWSPGGTQIAFVANMDENLNPADDFDIYRINSDSNSLEAGGPVVPNTTNGLEEDAPDWGPAILGP
jgi:hypothetical protein